MAGNEESLRTFGAIVARLTRGQNLSRAEACECWRQILEQEQPDLQQGAFIAALKTKGDTLEEIAGTFDALYEYDTIKVAVDTPTPLIDNCGTGADVLKTLNISTGAAIIASACGLSVVRHAARAISSHCGAVDVIEALGVNVGSVPELPKQSIERAGIGVWNAFLPSVHPKLARLMRSIRFGSTINLVGPLLNPTMPSYKVMGVSSVEAVDLETQILAQLGFKRAFVMHGLDDVSGRGMDELSTLGPTHVSELFPDGRTDRYVLNPEDLGLRRGRFEELASSRDVQRDALALLRAISGKDDGPRGDIVCLNAAPMLYIMGTARDLVQGLDMARQAVTNGNALMKLRAWVTWQNEKPEDGLRILERCSSGHCSRPGAGVLERLDSQQRALKAIGVSFRGASCSLHPSSQDGPAATLPGAPGHYPPRGGTLAYPSGTAEIYPSPIRRRDVMLRLLGIVRTTLIVATACLLDNEGEVPLSPYRYAANPSLNLGGGLRPLRSLAAPPPHASLTAPAHCGRIDRFEE